MSNAIQKAMPQTGLTDKEILSELDAFKSDDPDYKNGKLWSLVYYIDEAYQELLKESYFKYSSENGLNPTAFKSIKKLENDIIRATASILNGTDEVCGVVTSGGTESCLLAVKTYRDMAKDKRRIRNPEMIIAETAHVAWYKASDYFGVKIRQVPLDEKLMPDLKKLKKLINRNTVMILGSAPEYPHGIIDPIEAMGEIAQAHDIPLHVDACVGGFILPFMEMNGEEIPAWDYRVPGVTSISADIHKYGYAAKGASTITYRTLDYLRHQMFVQAEWSGGVFASSALLGTRPGGAYAGAWAALHHFGVDGYKKLADQTQQAVKKLKDGIANIPELEVIGDPQGPLFAYRSCSPDVNIFAIGDQMDEKGWKVNKVQKPNGLHAMVTAQHLEVADDYISDLTEAVKIVKENPELANQGGAATYGMIAHVPLRGVVKKKVLDMYSELYRTDVNSAALPASGDEVSNTKGLVASVLDWYVKRQSKKASKGKNR